MLSGPGGQFQGIGQRDVPEVNAATGQNLAAAVAYDIGTAPGQSDWAFKEYDAALSSVIAINLDAFTVAVAAGQGGAAGWDVVFPAAGAVLLAGLVMAGVMARLAEYALSARCVSPTRDRGLTPR